VLGQLADAPRQSPVSEAENKREFAND